MHDLRTQWPLAIAAALTFALHSGPGYARGGSGAGMASAAPASSGPARATTSGNPAAVSSNQSLLGGGSASSGPSAPAAAPTVTPPSRAAAATPQLAPVAPLSPQLPTQFATGGGARQPNLALSPGNPSSPGSSSASPSESAPSAPGGGGKTLAACMGFWDRETHMTKAEWKAACLRTMQEYPSVFR